VIRDWELYGVHFTSATEGWVLGQDYGNKRGALLHHLDLALSPNEGTIGTKLTIAGSDFGFKKGKVTVGGKSCKILEWANASITCEIETALPPPGPYDVVVKPNEPKGALPIKCFEAFTMMAPEIVSVDPNSGVSETIILISGKYFGSKQGKVSLGKQSFKVLSWTMDEVSLIIPKKMASGSYSVTVTNKVGSDTLAGGFTIR
jgi:hypothetical protein